MNKLHPLVAVAYLAAANNTVASRLVMYIKMQTTVLAVTSVASSTHAHLELLHALCHLSSFVLPCLVIANTAVAGFIK